MIYEAPVALGGYEHIADAPSALGLARRAYSCPCDLGVSRPLFSNISLFHFTPRSRFIIQELGCCIDFDSPPLGIPSLVCAASIGRLPCRLVMTSPNTNAIRGTAQSM